MEKVSLAHSILATKTLETSIDADLYAIASRFGFEDSPINEMCENFRNIVETVSASMRMRLLKLEHELNELIEKRKDDQ